MARKAIKLAVRTQVLTEAGYRCAVPTCRNILALDLHHIVEVAEHGGDTPDNLLALCALCHALYTRGTIAPEAIHAYKTILVGLSRAFDQEAIDNLLFIKKIAQRDQSLVFTSDSLLRFARLIAADLVGFSHGHNVEHTVIRYGYSLSLTEKGQRIIDAWFSGSRGDVQRALEGE